MANNLKPQNSRNVFQHQSHPSNLKRPRGGVRQDKRAEMSARPASSQPYRPGGIQRAVLLNRKLSRSQNTNRGIEKREPLTLWISPIAKLRTKQKAQNEKLSVSQTGAAIYERAIQEDVDMGYGALIEPVIERSIKHETASMRWLIVRQAYDIGQMKSMLSSLLALILKNDESYNKLMDRSEIVARQSITNITPQIRQMKEILDSWLANIEKESENGV